MADLVKMKSKTTFQNTRIVGPVDGLVNEGDTFETDVLHAKDLQRLGHADPVDGSLDDAEAGPLEPHHQVSERALVADRAKRAAVNPIASAAEMGGAARSEPDTVQRGRRA